jgi:hypothetical protein
MTVDEREISHQLLTLPRETRQHLVATYSDAAALAGEMIRVTNHGHIVHEIKRQQGMYMRIARALLDSLLNDIGSRIDESTAHTHESIEIGAHPDHAHSSHNL